MEDTIFSSYTLAESEAMLPDGFPAGLRVFVVDHDPADLRSLETMLLKCGYKVTISDCPLQDLELLGLNIDNYDVVLVDVDMTYIDGFQLLEIICREIDLPVIVLSADFDFKSVMRSMQYGAVDYLVKPVRIEELKLIWKHVAKKMLNEKKSINELRSNDIHIPHITKQSKNHVRKRDDDDNIDSKDDFASQKRARVSWTPKLHEKFINAVNQLGIDRAVPKKILDIMEVPGLTRENVASHLQKYRNGLKRNSIELDQQIFGNAKIRRESESFLPMTINECNANLCRNKSISSSYLIGQQSYDGHALIPQIWFSPPKKHQNNFCTEYMMDSLGNQIETQPLGLTTDSYMVNMSTQFSGYQSMNQSLNQLDCEAAQSYQNSWTSNGHNEPNSISQLESTVENNGTNIFLNNNVNDNNNSNEVATFLTFEQKQHQNSSNLDAQIYTNSVDVQSYNLEDHQGSNASNLAILSEFENMDDTDDLYVALCQFQY